MTQTTSKLKINRLLLILVFASFVAVLPSKQAYANTLGAITEYSLTSGTGPYGIIEGRDGNLWFTEQTANKIGKITKSGSVTRYSLPSGSNVPAHIELGPNGNPWFNLAASTKYGQIDYSGNLTIYNLPANADNGPASGGIVTGSDGNIWLGSWNANQNGSYIHTVNDQGGHLAKYSVSGQITELASDPARNQIWYAYREMSGGLHTGRQLIGKINENGTTSTPYVMPTGVLSISGITLGADGNIWFGGAWNKVGYVDNNGNFTIYTVPGSNTGVWRVRQGLDGNMWGTLSTASKIARITLSGTITTYNLTSGSNPLGLAAGTDGNMWFTEYNANKIGKIGTGVTSSSVDSDNDSLALGGEIAQGTSDSDSDTDNDGLSDYVESIEYTERAATFCGSVCSYPSPLRKDVFVEMDWMHNGTYSMQPTSTQINSMVSAFGTKGISLHVDYGQLGGGTQVDYENSIRLGDPEPGFVDFYDYKYGGDGISAKFDVDKRLGIWHYMLVGESYSEAPGSSGGSFSGDDDSFVSYGLLKDNASSFGYSDFNTALSGTMMHELGHNLCLSQQQQYSSQNVSACVYSGIDNNVFEPVEYLSSMNYRYQFTNIGYSSGTNGTTNDHNDWYAVKLHLGDFASHQVGDGLVHGKAISPNRESKSDKNRRITLDKSTAATKVINRSASKHE